VCVCVWCVWVCLCSVYVCVCVYVWVDSVCNLKLRREYTTWMAEV